ncbi:hypothetical protein CABS01_04411 [Colletotrichum abscissum]|uniref:Uncharacterized protein n=1 Tax=Colletotrichum lupini TaxID=145971 RepID=A0A9Q8SPC3_9PEZI|nr:uncharacterized protein CLUP02_05599 [Colletotrichum lupini]XP_060390627.1 uncharacterized protein CABS01_04411 [Colletotrichum abscissum]KAK1473749.1 hypothetical protein CABS01_04411 [Colletotrichum abscissum]UQC80117.1 hypothetical protein CLUP02_05599 [Colletotrichum lupini]
MCGWMSDGGDGPGTGTPGERDGVMGGSCLSVCMPSACLALGPSGHQVGGAVVLVGFWVPRCFGPTAPDDELCRFVGGMLCVGGLGREDGAASRSILILDEQNAGTVQDGCSYGHTVQTSHELPFSVLCSVFFTPSPAQKATKRTKRTRRDETGHQASPGCTDRTLKGT